MATAIPNFYRAQSPLGASVQGLASILMNQPSADERAAVAGQLALQQQSLADAQEKARVSSKQQGARTKLGDLLADPRLYDPLYRREPLAPPPETGDMGVTSTPIHRAALPDFGEIIRQGIEAGLDPEKLGGYVLFGSANANGMRDTRTQNAQVGAGQQYGNVAEAFDIGETNKIAINDADNKQSAANAALQAETSRSNNAADIAARLQIARMDNSPGVVASTTTAADGTVHHFDRFGQEINVVKGAGKPSANFERTAIQRDQLNRDLDDTIAELERATAPGGLIEKATGSGLGALRDKAAAFVGSPTEGSIAIGALGPIYDKALKMVPRFEGPQSDKDTQSYRDAAGNLSNPNVPAPTKLAAAKEMLRLMKVRKNQFLSRPMVDGGDVAAPAAGGVDDLLQKYGQPQ